MSNRIGKGKYGEQHAVSLLENKGHEILFTNYKWERKEVDIISLDKDELVFTEVKTRSNLDFGYPEASVDERKQQHIKQVAEAFLLDNPKYQKLRFDIIAVEIDGATIKEIVHWEAAFY